MNATKPVQSSTKATIFRASNGTPDQNMNKVLELAGGNDQLIGVDDIVVIKPNCQSYHHGSPNIAACNALVEAIFERPGFSGEVVIAENIHHGSSRPWEIDGWATPCGRNSGLPGVRNYNELCGLLKKKFGDRFSVCYLIDVGAGGKRVFHPKEGPGYVYCDGSGGIPLISIDNGLTDNNRREMIMTYPIFKTDRGTIIDFKNGIWKDGEYTSQPVKFINLAALNHHSNYAGMTSSLKNYFGIFDSTFEKKLSTGNTMTPNYYDFHSFAFNNDEPGPAPGMLGKEIGTFLNTIRKADLNITTAEWIGLTSRMEAPVAHTRTVLASTDPVALDYHAAKYLLNANLKCHLHDPDCQEGPIYQYLKECAEVTRYVFNEAQMHVSAYDFKTQKLQQNGDFKIRAKIDWGNNPKGAVKYALFRCGARFLH